MESILRAQWAELRAWLDAVDIVQYEAVPSGLSAWSVRDLVAHLGYGLVMLAEVQPASADAAPMPVGEYMARYQPAAPVIAQATREVSAGMADVLAGVDALAAEAWAAVEAGLPSVVLGRRGPLTCEDFLITRLVELVVHGDDLHRALPLTAPSPLVSAAVDVVAGTLADHYIARADEQPRLDDPLGWIRLATGRTPSQDPHLPLV